MKNFDKTRRFSLLSTIALSALLLSGCKEDEPEAPQPEPASVEIEASGSTETSLLVKVTPQNAAECALMAVTGEEAPDAGTIVSEGVPADVSGVSTVEIDGLAPQTTYEVYAVARNESGFSEIAHIRMITSDGPSVTLLGKDAGVTSLQVEVTPLNASSCAVVAVPSGSAEPSAADILQDGQQADASAASVIELTGLEPDTEYKVLAVASKGSLVSQTASVTMRTGEELIQDLSFAPDRAFGEYYGRTGFDSYNYLVTFTDIVFDSYGYATGAGYSVALDIFGERSDDPNNAVLPAGEYVVDKGDAVGTVCWDYGWSTFTSTDESGIAIETVQIRTGKMTVSGSSGNYTVKCDFGLEDGRNISFMYTGAIPFTNASEDTGFDVEITDPKIYGAAYIGMTDGKEAADYYFSLGNAEHTASGSLVKAGYQVIVDLWGKPSEDSDNAIIPDGTYTIASVNAEYTLAPYYTYAKYFSEDGSETRIGLEEGTLTVSRSGDQYTLVGNFVTESERKMDFTFTGAIQFTNNEKLPVGTVTDAVFTRGEAVTEVKGALQQYALTFVEESTGVRAEIMLYDNQSANPYAPTISAGTYTAVQSENAAAAKTFALGTKEYNYWYYGSWCYRKNYGSGFNAEAAVTGGTVSISSPSRGIYRVELDLTTTDGAFTGTYEGEIPYYFSHVPEPIGNINMELGYLSTRIYNHGVNGNGATSLQATFADGPIGANDKPKNGAGYMLTVRFFSDSDGEPRLVPGEYALDGTEKAGTVSSKNTVLLVYDRAGSSEVVEFKSGTVTVEDNGSDGYKITTNLVTARGETAVFRYDGPIAFPSR